MCSILIALVVCLLKASVWSLPQQRVGAGQLLTGNVTDEDLQLINTDHRQLMVEPPQQPKENNIVRQYVCGHENVCENKNEHGNEFFQWKNVSDMNGRYDWQIIVVLEDDPVVLQAATSLFEAHASISTLLRFHKGQILLLRGSRSPLTSNSQVTLVGHGGRASDGVVRLGAYGAEELARVVSTMGTQIGMVSLVGCELGKDLQFAEHLLRGLRSLGVESRLLLHSTLLSVSRSGEMLTRDEQEGVWRYGDDRTEVIAQLSQTGNLLTRVKEGGRGRVVLNYSGYALPKTASGQDTGARDWPKQDHLNIPQVESFIQPEYEEDPSLNLLEALAWAIFIGEDNRNNKRCEVTYESLKVRWKPATTLISPNWTPPDNPDVEICIITTLKAIVTEIHYHAKQYITERSVYYKINQYIYRVDRDTLYVHVVGVQKANMPKNEAEIKEFDNYNFERYSHITQKAAQFYHFYKNIGEDICYDKCYKVGHYFLAAVFSESVRNFRQFVLFLLSVVLCGETNDDSFIKYNPMTGGGTWPDQNKRGFYGWRANDREIVKKILEVLKKEKDLGDLFFSWIQQQCEKDNVELNDILQDKYLGGFELIDRDKLQQYCKQFKPCNWKS